MGPNVLFLVPEQLYADRLGCYGYPLDTSPNMDSFAREGVRFENCFSQTAKCIPSRVGTLSGRYASTGGYMKMATKLKGNDPNIVRCFREAGYRTFLFRKNHQVDESILAQTYDEFLPGNQMGAKASAQYAQPGSHPLWKALYRGENQVRTEDSMDARVVRRVADKIRECGEQPFFMWVSFWLAHPAFTCTQPYFSMFPRDEVPLPPRDEDPAKPKWLGELRKSWGLEGLAEEHWRELVATYAGMIRELDAHIAFLLNALREAGREEDTLVVIWADHGEFGGEHQMATKYDTALYDCLLKVPLIMRGPGLPAAQVRTTLVEAVDILPTVAEICDVEIPKCIHGESFLPCIHDSGRQHRDSVFAQAGYDGKTLRRGLPAGDKNALYYPKNRVAAGHPESMCRTAMARTKEWKLIHRVEGRDELYDLKNDPHELHNLFGDPQVKSEQESLTRLLLDRCIEAWTPVPETAPADAF